MGPQPVMKNVWVDPHSEGEESANTNNTSAADSVISSFPQTPVSGEWILRSFQPIFADAEGMKEKVRQSLSKPSCLTSSLYKDSGIWQRIARHPWFESTTFFFIAINAVWIAVDTDLNKKDILLEAHPVFIVGENVFCGYFAFEWIVRFMAFKHKKDGFRSGWFVFDSILVFFMILETWLMTIVFAVTSNGGGGMGDASVLRLVRLLRLTRMARMAKLLRALPELMILIKGMVAACRSVLLTLSLLVVVIYIFAILFTQITLGTDVGSNYFSSVSNSMYTLLVYGTFLDNVGKILTHLGDESYFVAGVFIMFILLAAMTLMNMLIGVLCEVVSVVAAVEKEEMMVSFVKGKLQSILREIDIDNDNAISKAEFQKLLATPDAVKAFNDVDVDAIELVDLADTIFDDGTNSGEFKKVLSFSDFMSFILQLRGTNTARVKDILTLKKLMRHQSMQSNDQLELTNKRLTSIEERIRTLGGSSRKSTLLRKRSTGEISSSSRHSTRSVTNRAPSNPVLTYQHRSSTCPSLFHGKATNRSRKSSPENGHTSDSNTLRNTPGLQLNGSTMLTVPSKHASSEDVRKQSAESASTSSTCHTLHVDRCLCSANQRQINWPQSSELNSPNFPSKSGSPSMSPSVTPRCSRCPSGLSYQSCSPSADHDASSCPSPGRRSRSPVAMRPQSRSESHWRTMRPAPLEQDSSQRYELRSFQKRVSALERSINVGMLELQQLVTTLQQEGCSDKAEVQQSSPERIPGVPDGSQEGGCQKLCPGTTTPSFGSNGAGESSAALPKQEPSVGLARMKVGNEHAEVQEWMCKLGSCLQAGLQQLGKIQSTNCDKEPSGGPRLAATQLDSLSHNHSMCKPP